MKKTIAALFALTLAGCATSNAAEVATQGNSTPEGAVYNYIYGVNDADFDQVCQSIDPSSRQALDEQGGCADVLHDALSEKIKKQFHVFDGKENYESKINQNTGIVTVSLDNKQTEFTVIKDDNEWFIAGGLE